MFRPGINSRGTAKTKLVGLLFLVAFARCSPEEAAEEATAEPPQLDAQLEEAFAYLATYTFGSDREPLEAVVTSVRDSANDPSLRAALERRLVAVASNDATSDAKRFVCRQLGRIGTVESVSALAGLLQDEGMAAAAIHAIERIPGDEASRALREAALNGEPPTRLAAINALGARGESDSAPTLIQLMGASDESLRRAAILALGRVGGEESCAALFARWEDDPVPGHNDLVAACLLCAEMEVGLGERARVFYSELIRPEMPSHHRTAAVAGLVRAEPERASAHLLDYVAAEDPTLFLAAIGLLRERVDVELALPLAGILTDLSDERAVVLMDALVARRDSAAQQSLVALLASESEPVGVAAATALGQLGDAKAVAPLVQFAATGGRTLREAVRASLAIIPDPQANKELLRFASDGESSQRLEAVLALKARNVRSAVPVLIQAAIDSDRTLYGPTLDALGAMASDDNIPALLDLLETSSQQWQREAVRKALVNIVQNSTDLDRASETLLLGIESKAAHPTILRVLGEFESSACLQAIREAATNSDPPLHMAAIEALSGWSTSVTLPDLEAIVQSGESGQAREAAFRGFTNIVRRTGDLTTRERLAHLRRMLDVSRNAKERNQALGALAELTSLEALSAADAWISDSESHSTALGAAVRIAGNIWGAYPKKVRTYLDELLEGDSGTAVLPQAKAVLAAIEASREFLTGWTFSGPYFEEYKTGGMIYDTRFPPEERSMGREWEVLRSVPVAERPWIANLGSVIGGRDRVVYLRTYVHADSEYDAVLETGSNDGIKVWLNGEFVFGLNVPRGLIPFQDKTPIHLKAGWNTLKLAIYQHGGSWEACARIVSEDGAPLEGIRSSAEPI